MAQDVTASRALVARRFSAFFDQATDRLAGLRARLFIQALKHLLQPRHMALGLLQVGANRLRQFLRIGGFRHLRQRTNQVFLGIVKIANVFDKKFLQDFLFHG